jgi:hypothetical protein
MKLFKTTQIYGFVIDDNNKKKERVEGRRDSTQRDTRVKTGQLRNSLSNFETGPCNLAAPVLKPELLYGP